MRVPYRIETPNLLLRPFELEDTPAMQRLIEDNIDHLRRWVPWAADEPKPLEARFGEVRTWRAVFDMDQMWHFAMCSASDGEVLGGVIVNRLPDGSVENGGWVGSAATRRGYAMEAGAAIARAEFEALEITRVQATTDPANEPSILLLRKLGFVHEATTRRVEDGREYDEMLWRMLSTEYPTSHAAEIAQRVRAFDALGRRIF